MWSLPRSIATISTTAAHGISRKSSRAIRVATPDTTIEVLTPDFLRKDGAAEIVVEARPDVFNHNLETVPAKYLTVRPGARYFASMRLLQQVKELDPQMFTKSGIMVGLGEERNEVLQVMDDLRSANVDFLTIGQYLQPTRKHHEVVRFVTPDEFKAYETIAYAKGFLMVSASPLTRSSHHAGDDFARLKARARQAHLTVRCAACLSSARRVRARRRCPMRLAAKLGVPVHYLDHHHWLPGWQYRDDADARAAVRAIAETPAWVMDGNFSGTFDLRMPRADTLVWLDYPRATCIRRVLMRAIKDYGRSKPDLPEGCPEQFDFKLLRWVWDFPAKHRPRFPTPSRDMAGT